jgi:UDP-N-acetylmuramoyl-L-alanyl-D-glutamate--2,6-diaminopimelate ligase
MSAGGPRSGARVSSGPVVRPFPPLADVAAAVPGAEVRGDGGTIVTEAASDSRAASDGCLFFCVPGELMDGHAFAAEALRRGAAAVVVDRWLDVDAPQVRVPSVRAAMGPMASVVFGHPARSLATVAITGTNGKTTVTYVLESIFRAAGLTPGLIGTTGARIAGEPVPLAYTTPEAPDLQRLLARMRDGGVRALAMEASSHALAQHRVDGITFDIAVFTNLSQDHLDYHGTMETYRAAKARLFDPALARHGVVNVDDAVGRTIAEATRIPVVTVAVERAADVCATDVLSSAEGISFSVDGTRFRSRLRGSFNVANALAAVATSRVLGIEDRAAVEGVAALSGVPGRMEPVEAGQGSLVVVDYAHTPDSIASVLRAARPLSTGRVIVVFGCGGDRDRAKRPLMGEAATANADLTIITSDNPRSEDPEAIIAQIEPGASRGGGVYVVEADRRVAIARAVAEAAAGDVVVIAGKGHETGQTFADGTVPFDDRAVAREAIEALAAGNAGR